MEGDIVGLASVVLESRDGTTGAKRLAVKLRRQSQTGSRQEAPDLISESPIKAARSKPLGQARSASEQSTSPSSSSKLSLSRESPICQTSATSTASRKKPKIPASQPTPPKPQTIKLKQSEDSRAVEAKLSSARDCKETEQQTVAESDTDKDQEGTLPHLERQSNQILASDMHV
ncbi:uncharacterized protein LOC134182778 [Corticium candelabrum]|uniref:uncharacterized protein LOC134182778 n=1 Tax=Corticium candelabrum TaxID=121492 RepID=UPI002E2539AE|nr:uncharacterized protein LOC134182778 [Corticium candelabrum]